MGKWILVFITVMGIGFSTSAYAKRTGDANHQHIEEKGCPDKVTAVVLGSGVGYSMNSKSSREAESLAWQMAYDLAITNSPDIESPSCESAHCENDGEPWRFAREFGTCDPDSWLQDPNNPDSVEACLAVELYLGRTILQAAEYCSELTSEVDGVQLWSGYADCDFEIIYSQYCKSKTGD